jgi:hypothetical protein
MSYKKVKSKSLDNKVFKGTYVKTKALNVNTHRAKGRRV